MTWDILGKSGRGERPTQQGDGTTEQEKYRTAFQQCTVLWNSLPEACPVVEPDPPTSSKESVWAAKLEHGVVCSYYDLFMRCCIKFALANDGAMPTDECFPCEYECSCVGISIGYTTQGMRVNEEQTLTVEGGVDGCVYAWGLVGGGTLSGEEGGSVVYTAPATNPNCESNAVVSLSVEGIGICGSLGIAISGTSGYAYVDYTGEGMMCNGGYCFAERWLYDCNDDLINGGLTGCTPYGWPRCATYGNPPVAHLEECWADCYFGIIDVRSDSSKLAGCCPEGLL